MQKKLIRHTDVLKLMKEDYESIRITHEKDQLEKQELLAGMSVFKTFSKPDLIHLCDFLIYKLFTPNKGRLGHFPVDYITYPSVYL